MLVSFQLTMPNRGSWNGQWSGQDRKYYLIKNISARYAKSQEHFKELLEKGRDSWYYSWNDGWGANVSAEVVTAAEAKKRRKLSDGFCGYEWMAQSIILYGYISTERERKEAMV